MDNQSPKSKGADVSESFIWQTLSAAVRTQGHEESVPYLRHWLRPRLEADEPDGAFRRVRYGMFQRVSDYSSRHNAISGEQMSWLFDALMDDSDQIIAEDKCLEEAQAVADPPPGAVLEVARYEEQAGMPIFVARWGHYHEGIPVERDYIQVLINGRSGRAFALHRKWHTVDETASFR